MEASNSPETTSMMGSQPAGAGSASVQNPTTDQDAGPNPAPRLGDEVEDQPYATTSNSVGQAGGLDSPPVPRLSRRQRKAAKHAAKKADGITRKAARRAELSARREADTATTTNVATVGSPSIPNRDGHPRSSPLEVDLPDDSPGDEEGEILEVESASTSMSNTLGDTHTQGSQPGRVPGLGSASEAGVGSPTAPSNRNKTKPAPSAASGGIPNPLPAYLLLASAPPITLPEPRQVLVVLDLNGTLLYRPYKRRPKHFIVRPHAMEFLAYCVETFRVVVWSSARQNNVDALVRQLMPSEGLRRQLLAVWARDRFGLTAEDYDANVQCYKRLGIVWADEEIQSSHPEYADYGHSTSKSNSGGSTGGIVNGFSHAGSGGNGFNASSGAAYAGGPSIGSMVRPGTGPYVAPGFAPIGYGYGPGSPLGAGYGYGSPHGDPRLSSIPGRWDQTNTVLVDDSSEKARSEPFNFVRVPEYAGDTAEASYILPQVHDYLNRLCYQANISSFIRLHPFAPKPDFDL